MAKSISTNTIAVLRRNNSNYQPLISSNNTITPLLSASCKLLSAISPLNTHYQLQSIHQRHVLLLYLRHTQYVRNVPHEVRVVSNSTALAFTSRLKGYENVTVQCQNCGNFSGHVYKRW